MGTGWIAFLLVGLLKNLVVGVAGAYIGVWLFSQVGMDTAVTFWGALIVAVIGAVILLWISGKLFKR